MINNVGLLGERHLRETNRRHLIHVHLDATILMNIIVVEKQWVLRSIAELFLFDIPSPVKIEVLIVKVFWLEFVARLRIPHRVREESCIYKSQLLRALQRQKLTCYLTTCFQHY